MTDLRVDRLRQAETRHGGAPVAPTAAVGGAAPTRSAPATAARPSLEPEETR
jgi:hypothetical protein